MKQDIEDYLEHLERRNRSETTIIHYRSVLTRCLDMLDVARPDDIGEKEIAIIMDNLSVSDNTMKNFLTIVGGFCEYHTGRNPVKRMKLLWNREHVRRKFIGRDDLKILLDEADPSERIVLILGAYMGLRRKEIASIRLDDIGDGSIRVHGKGHGRNGLVAEQPMPSMVKGELERYMKWRNISGYDGDLLVVTESNRGVIPMKGHLPAMSNRISRLGKSTGIEVTCHSLRRLYCTTLAESGCPLGTIKELMRHSDINTTLSCYIRPSGLHLEDWSEKCAEELSGTVKTNTDCFGEFQIDYMTKNMPEQYGYVNGIGSSSESVFEDKVTKSND